MEKNMRKSNKRSAVVESINSIAKRDRDRAAFRASHVSKHERDRQSRIVWVAVSGNSEGAK
jgi:hypothetical protein